MNDIIIQFIRNRAWNKKMNLTALSEQTGIEYLHLIRILTCDASISGSEFICLCKVLKVGQTEVRELYDLLFF